MSLYWVVAVIGGGDDGRGYDCFLFNILFSSFLDPFCLEAKETGIGMCHGKTSQRPEVLCNDSGVLFLTDIPYGYDRSCHAGSQFELFNRAVSFFGGQELPGEEDEP